MGSQRSKEDEVQKISTSVFVTNFPDQFNAKDLWNTCKQYGNVVDAYIPNRRSKAGSQPLNMEMENNPALVLDNLCLNQQDYSNFLMGKVKDFASLSNLKVVLVNEGFDNIEQKYMGGYWNIGVTWVEIEGIPLRCGVRIPLIVLLLKGVLYYMLMIRRMGVFIGKERVKWRRCGIENFSFVKGDSDVEVVPDSKFEEELPKKMWKRLLLGKMMHAQQIHSIFMTYSTKQDDNNKGSSVDDSLKYPPGYTPTYAKDVTEEHSNKTNEPKRASGECFHSIHEGEGVFRAKKSCLKKKSKDDVAESICSGHFQKAEIPRSGGSILQLMDDLVKVGQTIGYNMKGCMKNIEEFIESQGVNEANFLSLQETKKETLELFCIKRCWGNFAFDYVYSASVGNSGGILCVWDPKSFQKLNVTVSDLFVMIRGVLVPNDAFNLFISNAGLEEVPLDKGERDDDVVNKRTNVVRSLQELEKLQSLKAAQKAKIKWAIEGDENSKYYHGILNKKWSQLAIRGILVDGNWIDSPGLVKTDLECEVTKDEIKRAVWDCGIDKSLGPDRFTFGFYHQYWKIIESDVVDAVTCFFHQRLANRLVVVLGDLVNEVQSAFVADRQILDGPFILNELLQWCKSKKKQSLVFKVDFEKAYDSVRGSVIVNGSPTEEFQFYKGLKKGVPLSPFLFILVMESLHVSFQRVVDAASGLRINMSKSKLMGISEDADKVDQAAMKIGFVTLKTPFTYLGLKVGGLMSRIQSWNETVEGMVTRLSKWKMKTLSIGGVQHMESIRSYFFNGVELVGKKPIWVKWKNVLASKEKGGLGVSSLYTLNRTLMFKWVWRFFTQSSSLWARVIKAIHGEDGKIGKKVKCTYPSIWLDIVQEVKLFKYRGTHLVSYIHKKLRSGANTSFWEDAWRGDIAFKCLYPRVYTLELCKSIDVASKMAHSNLGYSFHRDPRGGVEQAQFDLMLAKVEGTSLVNMRDIWVWSLEGSGEFFVASVRKLIDDNMLPDVASKTRWIKSVPIKVNVHAWKVKLHCLPTRLNISRRVMDIESILCPMCGEAAESTSHIFFTCHIAREILRKISRWLDVIYTEVSSYE
ncbi:RNA-directed DNA polymerase, eukaryota, reverse transcriptase zinc-binding domain protein [Tanacetum coccineum]